MLFDTHVHLDRLPPGCKVETEIETARQAGIGRFLVPGVERSGWQGIAELAAADSSVLPAFGIHPLAAGEWGEPCRRELVTAVRNHGAVAIGEIGLDRFIDVPVARQEQAFREQLQVAAESALPVLVHCRRMYGRLLEILQEERRGLVGGILHAYGGSEQTARAALDLGFAVAFGGALTWPEARRAVEVASALPEDAIVIETDAPDMAPHPHRGAANRPVWLPLILERLAEIKGWSREQAAEITSINAYRVLRLKKGP